MYCLAAFQLWSWVIERLYGLQSQKYFWPFTENVCWPLIYTMGQKPEPCKLGPPSEGLQWNPSGISVSQSNNSCSRQVMFHSCSFRYILVRCNNHENWPVSTWLHTGENLAKSESTKQAQRKWNKLEIRCFLFVRFKWELCFLANSQCGQVTIFAGIFFFPLFQLVQMQVHVLFHIYDNSCHPRPKDMLFPPSEKGLHLQSPEKVHTVGSIFYYLPLFTSHPDYLVEFDQDHIISLRPESGSFLSLSPFNARNFLKSETK